MNKTVTINISGIIFHIEEDAYDSLSKYLATIKGYFSNTNGGNEIMSDIEARIAELLQQKINANKQVVLMTDVETVIGIMGKPEEFADDDTKQQNKNDQENQTNFNTEKIKRRLFRNPDEKAIGGVCSGLAAYFDIDIIWIRLAMFLLIFFGGLSLWVYIVMWIIIPEAKTTADKLAMRGDPINIDNISKTFKDEAKEFKNKYGKNFDKTKFSNNVRNGASTAAHTIASVFGRLLGLFILFIGGILLISYVAVIFGISITNSSSNIFENWKTLIFSSSSDYVWAIISFIVAFGIPVFMLIYTGIKLLFKIRYHNRWLNYSLGIIWLAGFILGFYITAKTVKEFTQTSKIKEIQLVQGLGDTIVVKLNPSSEIIKKYNFENADDIDGSFKNNNHNYTIGENPNSLAILGMASLDIVESNSDSVELIIYHSSKGNTKQEANLNAKAIKYSFKQQGNQLIFDQLFVVLQNQKFRMQQVDIKLKLPKGKVIYFDKSVKYLLDDIENTTNTWDGDMIGRRWKMTDKGLACIDCNNLDSDGNDDEDDEENSKNKIIINGKEIKVNDKDVNIKIDEDGIKIKTDKKDKKGE